MLTTMDRDDYRRVRELLDELDGLPLTEVHAQLSSLGVVGVMRDEVVTLLTTEGTEAVVAQIANVLRRAINTQGDDD